VSGMVICHQGDRFPIRAGKFTQFSRGKRQGVFGKLSDGSTSIDGGKMLQSQGFCMEEYNRPLSIVGVPRRERFILVAEFAIV